MAQVHLLIKSHAYTGGETLRRGKRLLERQGHIFRLFLFEYKNINLSPVHQKKKGEYIE